MKYVVAITLRGPDAEIDSKRISIIESEEQLEYVLAQFPDGYAHYASINVLGAVQPLLSWVKTKEVKGE